MNTEPGNLPLVAYRDWIVEQALPLWSTSGFDIGRGRFRERLDRDAAPINVPHRAMVQARQIYVFAHAAELGWFPGGGKLAEIAMVRLLREFYDEDGAQGSFAFSIAPDGTIVSAVRDAYTHAFALFALAWTYRLNGDPKLLAVADRTIAFIEATLEDHAHGGLFDAMPVVDRAKRQNPLMHLLEAYLFLEGVAPGAGYLERAGRIVRLFETRLFRPERGVLLEYFAEDWSAHPNPAKRDVFEPGHHFEWAWLLDRYAAMAGITVLPAAEQLYAVSMKHGFAPSGLIHDEVGADFSVRKSSHRLWPHTEAIKAAAVRQGAGDPDARGMADGMAALLLEHFCGRPFAGGWTDQMDAASVALVDYVPASSLYHLFLAAAEADRCFDATSALAPAEG